MGVETQALEPPRLVDDRNQTTDMRDAGITKVSRLGNQRQDRVIS